MSRPIKRWTPAEVRAVNGLKMGLRAASAALGRPVSHAELRRIMDRQAAAAAAFERELPLNLSPRRRVDGATLEILERANRTLAALNRRLAVTA